MHIALFTLPQVLRGHQDFNAAIKRFFLNFLSIKHFQESIADFQFIETLRAMFVVSKPLIVATFGGFKL